MLSGSNGTLLTITLPATLTQTLRVSVSASSVPSAVQAFRSLKLSRKGWLHYAKTADRDDFIMGSHHKRRSFMSRVAKIEARKEWIEERRKRLQQRRESQS